MGPGSLPNQEGFYPPPAFRRADTKQLRLLFRSQLLNCCRFLVDLLPSPNSSKFRIPSLRAKLGLAEWFGGAHEGITISAALQTLQNLKIRSRSVLCYDVGCFWIRLTSIFFIFLNSQKTNMYNAKCLCVPLKSFHFGIKVPSQNHVCS